MSESTFLTLWLMRYSLLVAIEWVGPKEGERNIQLKFDETRKKLHVTDRGGRKPLRMIDLRYTERIFIRLSVDKMKSLLSVRAPGEIDLVRLQYKVLNVKPGQKHKQQYQQQQNRARQICV